MPVIDPRQSGKISHLELLARQVVEGFITGMHKSPFHGFSVEFAEHRLYNTGESTRHIDWKLYARSDKLFVKKYEEETNLRCRILIDTSPSMYYPYPVPKGSLNKIGFSINCSAALIELLKRQSDAVGVSLFSDKVFLHTPVKSSFAHQKMLFNELESVYEKFVPGNQEKTKVTQALDEIAENTHKRSLVIIFSDMFDSSKDHASLFNALQHLRHKKHEVILFHVTDKKHEMDFEFENRPYAFVDLESGDEVKLQPAEIKEIYTKKIKEFASEIGLKCAQYNIDYVQADIAQGYYFVLSQYLIKRAKLY